MRGRVVGWMRGRRAVRVALAVIAGAVFALGLYQLPFRGAVNVGDEWDALFVPPEGVYSAEQGGGIDFRWSGRRAEIELPGIVSGGPVTVSLWVGGLPGSTGQEVRAIANGHELAPMVVAPLPAKIDSSIPADWLESGGNLRLALSTTAAKPPGEERELGLLLDRVAVEGAGGALTWPDPAGVLAAALLAGLAALIGGRWGAVVGLGLIAAAGGILLARPWYGLVAPSIVLLCLSLALAVTVFRRGGASRKLAFDRAPGPSPRPSPLQGEGVLLRVARHSSLSTQHSALSTAAALAGALFALYVLLLPGHFFVIDDDEKYRVTEAQVTRGEVRMEPPVDGRVYSKYGLGHSLASAPLLVAGLGVEQLLGRGELGELRKMFVLLLNPLCTAVTAGLLMIFAERLWASRRRALLIAATYGLSTFAFPHALFGFSEPLITLLLLGSVYFVFRGVERADSSGRMAEGGRGLAAIPGPPGAESHRAKFTSPLKGLVRGKPASSRYAGNSNRLVAQRFLCVSGESPFSGLRLISPVALAPGGTGALASLSSPRTRVVPTAARQELPVVTRATGEQVAGSAPRVGEEQEAVSSDFSRRTGPGVQVASFAIAGALFGFLVLTKIEFILVAPLLLIYYLYKSRGNARAERLWGVIAFVVPLAGFVALLLAYNALRYGSAFSTGYEAEPFSTPFWEGLYGLVLSSGKSMFFYSPPLLLAIIAWPEFLRRRRAEAMLVAVLGGGMLVFYARWWQWSGDWTWGPRFTLPLVPLLLLGWGALDFDRIATRVAAGGLFALGVAAQVPGILADWRLNFLRFATPEENAAHLQALWFDPGRSPLLLDSKRLVVGPDLSAVLHISDYGLPAWADLWVPHLILALLLVALAVVARGAAGSRRSSETVQQMGNASGE